MINPLSNDLHRLLHNLSVSQLQLTVNKRTQFKVPLLQQTTRQDQRNMNFLLHCSCKGISTLLVCFYEVVIFRNGGLEYMWISLSSEAQTFTRCILKAFVLIFALRLKLQPVTQIRLHCSFCCLSFSFVEL